MKGMNDTIDALIPILQSDVRLIGSGKLATKEKHHEGIVTTTMPATTTTAATRLPKEREWSVSPIHSMIAIVIFLVFGYLFSWRSPRHDQGLQNDTIVSEHHPHHQQQQQQPPHIVWRAVFLRDLEDGLAQGNITLEHVNPR